MIVNFIGNFGRGYVGEEADEVHLARELEALGNKVNRVPRDVWKAYVDGHPANADWVLPEKADINIICKWPHFDKGLYIDHLKQFGPVFYWVWDWMNEFNQDNWNYKMARAADLYLTGEGGLIGKYRSFGIPAYYFQMDVCDGNIEVFKNVPNIHDAIFTGSWVGKGHRQEWLKAINKEFPIRIFTWNPQDWPGEFETYPAVYGPEYNMLVAQSKTVLGFNVEPNCYGYWSNRVGKVLRAGGHLLQEYTPGMEIYNEYNIDFFSSPKEAVERVKEELIYDGSHSTASTFRFTSASKMQQLMGLVERYNERKEEWII